MRVVQWCGDKLDKLVAKFVPARLMTKTKYFELFQSRGYHVTAVHYYQPIPDTRAIPPEVWARRSAMIGIDFNEPAQLEQLARITEYREEYAKFPYEETDDPTQYFLKNHSFMSVDAEALHGMIRHHRPKRMIEIGSGRSTLIATAAIRANTAEGSPCQLTVIEPFPWGVVDKDLPGVDRMIQSQVQSVPLSEFEALEENDILFIDSTHIAMVNSDVVYEYLEILPRLRPGVIVHIHDIFIPAEYPKGWIEIARFFWNEQYVLQAFLAFNRQFSVMWAGHYMHLTHADKLHAAFPSYANRHWPPSSFWMRRL